MDASPKHVAVIGGGPAGLMAAERLSTAGVAVTVYDQMPSVGRKFLLAGRGGLNLTHSEALPGFLRRYREADGALAPAIHGLPPKALRAWAEGLGQPTFVGSSGRVFPAAMKASPLLRAWLARLVSNGVAFRLRREWRGWDANGHLCFTVAGGEIETTAPDAVILALGGASWPRLGSTGEWAEMLKARGVSVAEFRPSNAGFRVEWTAAFRDRFHGQPLKNAAFRFGAETVRGEAVITRDGLEGGAVYALSATLRDATAEGGAATLTIDLRPDVPEERLAARLQSAKAGQSRSNLLRKAAGLSPLATNLLREGFGTTLTGDPAALAASIKRLPITVLGPQPLERAISSAGGIRFSEIDQNYMLRRMPGTFAAGEMLDWEAPTGGYLLQASFATGVAAAEGALAWLARRSGADQSE